MSEDRHRPRARATIALGADHALRWLGSALLGWLALSLIETSLQAPPSPAALAHATALALGAALLFGVPTLCLHGLALLARRYLARPRLALASLLTLVALMPSHRLSGFLTSGRWIAALPAVDALRHALTAALLGAWLLLWALHARALQPRPASAARTALFWSALVLAVIAPTLALRGPLRAYAPLADALLFPVWLLVASALHAALARWPRAHRRVAVAALALACAPAVWYALSGRQDPAARMAAIAHGGWAARSDLRLFGTPDAGLPPLDFDAVDRAACRHPPAPPPALPLSPQQRRNVIFLSIDTMRRDALERRYGKRQVAPQLRAFGERALAFERAVAAAPGTVYSLGSLFTGLSVGQLLFLPDEPDNLFARTRDAFDRQHAVLPRWKAIRGRQLRLVRPGGRERVTYVPRAEDASKPMIELLKRARADSQRLFAWLHLVDAHAPYKTKPGFDFGDDAVDRYYSEVAHDDAIIGRVLSALRELGYFADSLIVVFADHGESLGEGGYWGHGVSPAARFMDIPLMLHAPGVAPGRSQAAVSLTDIAPTVLHFLGLPQPPDFAGHSLLSGPAVLSRRAAVVTHVRGIGTRPFGRMLEGPITDLAGLRARLAALESPELRRFSPKVAVAWPRHRYMLEPESGLQELYDRVADPEERHNLVARRPDLVAQARLQLARWTRAEAERIVCRLPGMR